MIYFSAIALGLFILDTQRGTIGRRSSLNAFSFSSWFFYLFYYRLFSFFLFFFFFFPWMITATLLGNRCIAYDTPVFIRSEFFTLELNLCSWNLTAELARAHKILKPSEPLAGRLRGVHVQSRASDSQTSQ